MTFTKGMQPTKYWLGKKHSAETRKKISDSLKKKGVKPPPRFGAVPHNKGKRHLHGEKNPRWKGGEYKYRRREAKIRDDYTCQICGLRDPEIMETDHIKEKCDFPELKHSLENLITICPNCHRRKTNRFLRAKYSKHVQP